MEVKKKFFLVLLLASSMHAQVRIVLSAALTHVHFEFRKQQYIDCLNILAGYGYKDVYIVEALKKGDRTFLEDYSKNVFYATVNIPGLRNNGVNEARTILEGSYHFAFDPDDIIIKLTGRYQLTSDAFFKFVEENPEYDAIVKIRPPDHGGGIFTACFAMRCKYLKEMYEQMDYNVMERDFIHVEWEVDKYIKQKIKKGNFKVLYVDNLGVKANLFASTNLIGAGHHIIYF